MVGVNKMVLSGKLDVSGQCRWSTGFYFGGIDGDGGLINESINLQTWCIATANTLDGNTAITNLKSGLGPTGTIDRIDGYYYQTLGGPTTAVGGAAATISGAGTYRNPVQTSVVASLRTPLAGRSYRGRSYWPAVGYLVLNTGRFNAGVPEVVAEEYAAMLGIIVAAATAVGQIEPVIASTTKSVVTAVTQISVGDVPDTQRRRRDNLVEVYSSEPYQN